MRQFVKSNWYKRKKERKKNLRVNDRIIEIPFEFK